MMKSKDIKKWILAVSPIQRRSSTDWVLPSVIGLGIGVAAGVGLGMILAPQSGHETRRRLRSSADDLKHKAMTFADKARSQMSTTAAQLGNGLTRAYSESDEIR